MAATTAAAMTSASAATATMKADAAYASMSTAETATSVIELRMMPTAAVMIFPGMMYVEAGVIAPTISPTPAKTVGVRRIAILRVSPAVAIAFITAARTARDHGKQKDRCDHTTRAEISFH